MGLFSFEVVTLIQHFLKSYLSWLIPLQKQRAHDPQRRPFHHEELGH